MADSSRLTAICADLAAEHEDLDALVSDLPGAAFDRASPAPGWSIRDQISHLAWFDERALEAVTSPEEFRAGAEALLADFPAAMDRPAEIGRAMTQPAVLAWWRGRRTALLAGLAEMDPEARLPWYGPDMGAVSFVTARLMETWAHGQDVADALGTTRPPTVRLRHVAHIGVAAMAFSFRIHGLPPPVQPVRVELSGPHDEAWAWGALGASNLVRGDALEFCLVVTQRRHLDDVRLRLEGPVAEQWMGIAQAFAGPPGEGRRPGQFAREGG